MAAILSTSFAAAVTDWAATWSLASVTGVQIGHLCAAESELAQVTKVGPGTTVTVRRGVEGTAVTAHPTRTPVIVYRADEVRVGSGAVVTSPLVRQAVTTLTHAQFIALKDGAITQLVVPAQGVNRLIVVTEATLLTHFPTVYSGDVVDDSLSLVVGTETTALVVNSSVGTDMFLHSLLVALTFPGGDSVMRCHIPRTRYAATYKENQAESAPDNLVDCVNQPLTLQLYCPTLAGGAAANTLMVTVQYLVLDVTTGVWV